MSSISTSGVDPLSGDPIEQKVVPFIAKPLPARITSAAEYEAVADDLKITNALLKEVCEHHDDIIASAYATHKLALQKKAKVAGPLEQRKAVESRLIGDYQAAQARARAEEERRRRAAAEAVERERREKEAAEARRIASEKAAEEERARNDAEAARQLADEAFDKFDGPAADGMRAEAESSEEIALRASLERQEAERNAREIESAPIVAPAVRVEDDTPKVEGVSGRTTWYAEITDKRKFIESVVANWRVYENVIPWDAFMPALNSRARAVKKEIEIEPGVVARPKYGAAVKS